MYAGEQLLADLRRGGLLHGEGSYRLARSPKNITLMDVVACMEGKSATDKQQNGR